MQSVNETNRLISLNDFHVYISLCYAISLRSLMYCTCDWQCSMIYEIIQLHLCTVLLFLGGLGHLSLMYSPCDCQCSMIYEIMQLHLCTVQFVIYLFF